MKTPKMKRRVETLRRLPVHPYVLGKLLDLLGTSQLDVRQLAQVAFSDPGMGAYLLKTVNEGSFLVPSAIPLPEEVVGSLGLSGLRNAVLRLSLEVMFDGRSYPEPYLDAAWRRALSAGAAARLIAEETDKAGPQEAYVAGLLHDVGALALVTLAREAEEDADQTAEAGLDRDTELDHAVAGKWLAESWNLPETLVQVIWLHHHSADRLPGDHVPAALLDVISVAGAIAQADTSGSPGPAIIDWIPEGVLARLGLSAARVETLALRTQEAVKDRIASFALDRGGMEELRNALRRATAEALESSARSNSELNKWRRQAAHFKALFELDRRLRPGHGFPETLNAIAETIRADLRIAPGICCALDPQESRLTVLRWRDLTSPAQPLAVDTQGEDHGTGAEASPGVLGALHALGLGLGKSGWAGANLRDVAQWGGLVAAPMLVGDQCFGQILFDASACSFDLDEDAFQELLAFATGCGVALARCHRDEGLSLQLEQISQGLRRDDEIQVRLRQAERMARLGEYALSAAHALNTPLNLAAAQIHWFSGRLPDPRDRETVETIFKHTRNARRTVKDLLYLARPAQPRQEPTLINYILHQYLTQQSEEFAERKAHVTENLADGLPRVLIDRRQMEQALGNLLAHGVEAGGGQGVALNVQTWASPDRREVFVRVADTAPGLSINDPEELFDPLSIVRNQPRSTGLGLAVSREIIRAHGGSIEAESDPESGTAFLVRLPAVQSKPSVVSEIRPLASIQPEVPRKEHPLIVVADDDAEVRRVLDKALASKGFTVQLAADGDEAVRACLRQTVDLLLLDLRMPRGDGYTVMARLRELGQCPGVIAMTGSSRIEELEDAVQAGARSCLQKPFQLKRLLTEIEEALTAQAAASQ